MMNLHILSNIVILSCALALPSAVIAQEDLPLGDGLTSGPGLFSGEDGAFTIYEKKSDGAKEKAKDNAKPLASANEFETFKKFLQAKTDNTEEYKTFLIWIEYQNYLKQKQD